MRSLVDAPFVFLDSDALVIAKIDEAFFCETPIAAALDLNSTFPYPHSPEWIQPIYDHFGWAYPVKHYFNTGVVYWADTPETWRLSELWHERWQTVVGKFGTYQDQPSFNSAVADLGIQVKVLPTECNAMVEAHPRFAKGARIFHFFASKPSSVSRSKTLLGHLLNAYQLTKQIDWQAVESATANSDAWVGLTEDIGIEWARRYYRRVATTIWKRGWRIAWRRAKRLNTLLRDGKSPLKH